MGEQLDHGRDQLHHYQRRRCQHQNKPLVPLTHKPQSDKHRPQQQAKLKTDMLISMHYSTSQTLSHKQLKHHWLQLLQQLQSQLTTALRVHIVARSMLNAARAQRGPFAHVPRAILVMVTTVTTSMSAIKPPHVPVPKLSVLTQWAPSFVTAALATSNKEVHLVLIATSVPMAPTRVVMGQRVLTLTDHTRANVAPDSSLVSMADVWMLTSALMMHAIPMQTVPTRLALSNAHVWQDTKETVFCVLTLTNALPVHIRVKLTKAVRT